MACTYLRSAPAGLNRENPVSKEGEELTDEIRTSSIRVRAEIKGTIVVFGWVRAVGRNKLPNLLGEIEVADHVLRDRAVVVDKGRGIEALIVVRDSETFCVWREDILDGVVRHVAREEGGLGGEIRFLVGYKLEDMRNPEALGRVLSRKVR